MNNDNSANTKNTILFFVLCAILFGGYLMLTKPPAGSRPAQPAAQPSAQAPAAPAAPALPRGAANPSAPTFTHALGDLQLTWRTTDGAIVQAVWNQDGTKLFPEETRDKDGKEIAQAFPGLGGTVEAKFSGEPAVAPDGQSVTFSNPAGDKLVYRLPAPGHVLEVSWSSPGSAPLALVRMPGDPKQVHNMNRVFSLTADRIDTVTWSKMLSDSFFGFVKKKELPPATPMLGMDAGIDTPLTAQRSYYFTAIWDLKGTVNRQADRGYFTSGNAAEARLYLGPKQAEQLAAFGQPFTQVLDFGFFGLVAKGMFWILRAIHGFIPNWGWTIVVFSILLRLALWPLNTKTTTQMLRMKDLEPHQKVIQEKYAKFGNDMTKKGEMQKELMAFYKKNGHNPMGGCLPMLLQMPVFFALWSMLSAVFELRHAPFLGWITNLSAKDPWFILPVLMGASMVAQQAMTPATGDPAQRKMMMWMMPAMMVFFFSSTPSGLCLYYLIFNLIGMAQTWWIKTHYKPQPVVI